MLGSRDEGFLTAFPFHFYQLKTETINSYELR